MTHPQKIYIARLFGYSWYSVGLSPFEALSALAYDRIADMPYIEGLDDVEKVSVFEAEQLMPGEDIYTSKRFIDKHRHSGKGGMGGYYLTKNLGIKQVQFKYSVEIFADDKQIVEDIE